MPRTNTEIVSHWEQDLKTLLVENQTLNANTLKTELSGGISFDLEAHNQGRHYVGSNSVEYTNVLFFGECNMVSESDTLGVYVSHNNNDWYLLSIIQPTKPHATFTDGSSSKYYFVAKTLIPLRFVAIGNLSGNNITNITIHYNLMKLKK
tara:strand:- start:1189 stop:1638 length:450 start_codon:yes stop_codon:yes gene_type:complete